MKKYVIFFVGLLLSGMVFGQNETKMLGIGEVEITPPKFTGVTNVDANDELNNSLLIKKYLQKNIDYPGNELAWLNEGTEVVKFTITPTGDVTDFKIVNSVSPDVDKEMVRVLRTTNGMWSPGYKNGVATSMEQEISAVFGNNKDGKIIEDFVNKATAYFKQGSNKLFFKNNPGKALKSFNMGIKYLPNDQSLLLMRGMCYYELGQTEKAKTDWNKVSSIGGMDITDIANNLTGMSGYGEMKKILANNK
jgi:tetratricopeptide (TPR) repeat protein